MIRMIHRDTGSVMWVHETRLAEYLEAGHSLAPAPPPPQLPERPKRPAKTPKN